jgi:hypothetical protein
MVVCVWQLRVIRNDIDSGLAGYISEWRGSIKDQKSYGTSGAGSELIRQMTQGRFDHRAIGSCSLLRSHGRVRPVRRVVSGSANSPSKRSSLGS